MKCINCSSETIFYFEKKGFNIYRCKKCFLMMVQNVPDDLAPFYSEGYFTGDVTLDGYMDYDNDKEVTKKTYYDFLKNIEKFVPAQHKRSMFEVGCATGFFLKLAADNGWQVEGIDISSYAIRKALDKGVKAEVNTIEHFKSNNIFDALVMQDVIEHVKDPVALLQNAYRLTGTNGVIALTTPDAGSMWAKLWGRHWHAFVPPQHLYYFTVKNLTQLLEKNGFSVVYMGHHGKWFTIPYIIRLLYSWTGLKLFSKFASFVASTFLKRISIPINVRDTIYIIAKKI